MTIDWRQHQRWVHVQGRPVNLVEIGEGPPLVFVHGLSGNWQNWLEQLPEFSRDHRCVAVDLPGFGESPMPAEKITISGYGRWLDALFEVLEIEAAAVVGNSMGGFIAAETAIKFPHRVERLVLVHINPEDCDDDELATSARAHFAASEVGRDGLVLV